MRFKLNEVSNMTFYQNTCISVALKQQEFLQIYELSSAIGAHGVIAKKSAIRISTAVKIL
jgi:hypothetical protein